MKRLIIFAIGMFLTTMVCANELEIISLKHRSAEELLPVIRPLLNKDEVASGMNYQLIIRASPRSIAQIRQLLDSIDTLPRKLKITVMQNVDSDTVARLTEVSGSVGIGQQGRITLPGTSNTVGDGQGVHAQIISTRSLDDDRKTQQLQVLDGSRARVASGQTMPVQQRQVVQSAWGTQVIDTTQYRDVDSGFYVLPRIHGDTVTLEISTQNDSLAPNQNAFVYPATRTQQTTSTVSGRLGEWIVIGGAGQQGSTDSSTITTRSTSRVNEQRNVLIKVDEVN